MGRVATDKVARNKTNGVAEWRLRNPSARPKRVNIHFSFFFLPQRFCVPTHRRCGVLRGGAQKGGKGAKAVNRNLSRYTTSGRHFVRTTRTVAAPSYHRVPPNIFSEEISRRRSIVTGLVAPERQKAREKNKNN